MKETIKRFFQTLPSKIKTTVLYAVLAYICGTGVFFWYGRKLFDQSQKFTAIQTQQNEDQTLGKFVVTLMNIANAPLTEFQRQTVAQAIVRVSGGVFQSYEERKAFAILVAIESKFDKNAKSPVGAMGLTQVMPKYVSEFAGRCGIKDVKPTDLVEIEQNLTLGACQFRELLNVLDGNIASALVAYNAGLSSGSLKELRSLKNIANTETASYVTKYTYLRAEVDKNVPAPTVETSLPIIGVKIGTSNPVSTLKEDTTTTAPIKELKSVKSKKTLKDIK